MKYMLDTNICIYLIREHPKQVVEKFKFLMGGNVTISSVVLSELSFGACKSLHAEKNIAALAKFTIPISVVPYDKEAARYYGEIRFDLEKRGLPIGPMDLMIAAHALAEDAILVTNNLKEFSRIKMLKCENWA